MNALRFDEVAHLCFVLVFAASGVLAQEHFADGPHKGFTKSPTEHIIVELDTTFVVKSPKGVVTMQDYGPLEGVLVELRGPSPGSSISSTMTDSKGRFEISGLGSGHYRFKATKNGWQSVVGTIVVSPKAKANARININMPVGV